MLNVLFTCDAFVSSLSSSVSSYLPPSSSSSSSCKIFDECAGRCIRSNVVAASVVSVGWLVACWPQHHSACTCLREGERKVKKNLKTSTGKDSRFAIVKEKEEKEEEETKQRSYDFVRLALLLFRLRMMTMMIV